jgi:hypothetical protein
MLNTGFLTKLSPNGHGITRRRGDVAGRIGFLIADRFIPAVFVAPTHVVAIWVMVVFAQVESIYAAGSTMDHTVGERLGQRIIAPSHEQRITGVGSHLRTKLDTRRVVLILAPGNVGIDTFGVVRENGLKLVLR